MKRLPEATSRCLTACLILLILSSAEAAWALCDNFSYTTCVPQRTDGGASGLCVAVITHIEGECCSEDGVPQTRLSNWWQEYLNVPWHPTSSVCNEDINLVCDGIDVGGGAGPRCFDQDNVNVVDPNKLHYLLQRLCR